jgi:hypothetical protein
MGVDDYRSEVLCKNTGAPPGECAFIQEMQPEDSTTRYRAQLVVIYQILYDVADIVAVFR